MKLPSILASLCLLAAPATALAQQPAARTSGPPHSSQDDAPTKAAAASLQKKANEAQARITGGGDGGDQRQLIKAVETDNVSLTKKILLKNGFTAKDLENAKISLRTGGTKGGESQRITITIKCCPLEIIITRR